MDWAISRENEFKAAYALGAFTGDGSVTWSYAGNGGWFTTRIDCMDVEIVRRWAREVLQVFGKSYAINNYKTKYGTVMYTASAKRKEVYDFFIGLTANKTRVPEGIARSNGQVVRDYIAGLFDTDGTVVFNNENRYQLKFGQVERRLVEETAAMLQREGVKVGKICEYTKSSYRTLYTIQPNIRSFIDAGFYFECNRKQKRLQEYEEKVASVASETLHAAPVTTGEDKVHV